MRYEYKVNVNYEFFAIIVNQLAKFVRYGWIFSILMCIMTERDYSLKEEKRVAR